MRLTFKKKLSHFLYLDEAGTLLVYDILLESDSPRQVITLSFEYGGISEICWLDTGKVAVGTTRGRIVVFSIKGEHVCCMTFPLSRMVDPLLFLEAVDGSFNIEGAR